MLIFIQIFIKKRRRCQQKITRSGNTHSCSLDVVFIMTVSPRAPSLNSYSSAVIRTPLEINNLANHLFNLPDQEDVLKYTTFFKFVCYGRSNRSPGDS